VIDPVQSTGDRDLELIRELGLRIKYVIDSHVHEDHFSGAARLAHDLGAQTMISERSQGRADIKVVDGMKVRFGEYYLEARATPGAFDGAGLSRVVLTAE
jgi:sulfur dioxygenase